jgi:NTE family protein
MTTTPSSTPRISSTTTSDGLAVTRTPLPGNWPMPDRQVDATGQAGTSTRRALVLAGGGAAGHAWELGLIAGLADAGVDVTEAGLIIGTSAGSTVAAQVTSGTRPAELYAAILAEVPQRPADGAGSDRGRAAKLSGPSYMEWSNQIIGSAEDASDMRRRMGAAALELDVSDGSSQRRWRDIVAARLPSRHWPQQAVLITAVDARTGEPVVFVGPINPSAGRTRRLRPGPRPRGGAGRDLALTPARPADSVSVTASATASAEHHARQRTTRSVGRVSSRSTPSAVTATMSSIRAPQRPAK